ncbi:hypothetical protein [Niallia sp. 03190]
MKLIYGEAARITDVTKVNHCLLNNPWSSAKLNVLVQNIIKVDKQANFI